MKKSQSLIELAANIDSIESQIESVETEISELKSLLKKFTDPDRRFDETDPLPSDFDFAATSALVTARMQERHRLTIALDAANAEYEATKKVQSEAAMKSIKARHAESVIRLLQSALAFASAVTDQAKCCQEAGGLDRRYVAGSPQAIGPPFAMWDLRDSSCIIYNWLREAKHWHFITGKEPWLAAAGIRL